MLNHDWQLTQSGQQRWREVTRLGPGRELTPLSDVAVPGLQALLLALPTGLITLAVAQRLTPQLALDVSVIGGCAVFSLAAREAILWARNHSYLEEVYHGEHTQAARQEREHLRVEIAEQRGATRTTIYADLGLTSAGELRAVLAVGPTKRSLIALGYSDERARRLLADLLKYGLIHYPEGQNRAAALSARGAAVLRGLSGGGVVGEWPAAALTTTTLTGEGGDEQNL